MKIIFVSIFIIFILLISPLIPAIESNSISDESKLKVILKIKNTEMNINDLKEQIRNIEHIELNKNIKELKEKIEKIDMFNLNKESKYKNQLAQPKCIIITLVVLKIILKIISVILELGVKILFLIADTIVFIFKLLISIPITIIQIIISVLIYIIDTILNAIFDILTPSKLLFLTIV